MLDNPVLDNRDKSRTFSRRSLHGQVAHEIGLRIVSGVYAPGAVLPNEIQFSAELDVSRTAYREALKVLASKGLIESRPKIGTTVRPRTCWNTLDPDILAWIFASGPDPRYGAALFELRRILEPAAAGLAALRHTPETLAPIQQAFEEMEAAGEDLEQGLEPDLRFHRAIFEATDNALLAPMVFLIESALSETIKLSSSTPGARLASIPLHRDLLDAITRRDQPAAQQATLVLLGEAEQDMTRVLENQSPPDSP
ncbi:FadR/GntR family transcriptional regulator [Rhodovibrionaceae bacterium A322]